jgi:hypothetical protein
MLDRETVDGSEPVGTGPGWKTRLYPWRTSVVATSLSIIAGPE